MIWPNSGGGGTQAGGGKIPVRPPPLYATLTGLSTRVVQMAVAEVQLLEAWVEAQLQPQPPQQGSPH